MNKEKVLEIVFYKGNNPFILNIRKKLYKYFFEQGEFISFDNVVNYVKALYEVPTLMVTSKPLSSPLSYECSLHKFKFNKKATVIWNPHFNNEKYAYSFKCFYEFPNLPFNKTELEYIERNLNFNPYKCGFSIPLDDKNKEFLKKQFKKDITTDSIKIDYLIGETKKLYHFKTNNKYFWIKKTKDNNVYELSYKLEYDNLNFDKVNSLIKANWSLLDFQEETIKFLLYQKKCFLLLEQGMGKTASSIAATLMLEHLLQKEIKVLVLARSSLKVNWSREIDNFNQSSKIIKGSVWDNSDAKFTIINREILKNFVNLTKRDKTNNELCNENYDVIIVDEVQDYKGKNTKCAKALTKIIDANSIEYVWGLSGTLFEKNEELFSLYKNMKIQISNVIETEYFYKRNYELYKKYLIRYCGKMPIVKNGKTIFIDKKDENNKKIINTNSLELRQNLKHKFFVKKKDTEFEGFVKKDRYPIYFKLSLTDEKRYMKLFDEYQEERIKKGLPPLEEAQEVVETLILRKFLAEKKINYAINFIKDKLEDGDKLIIFTHFKKQLEKIVKKFGDKFVHVDASYGNDTNQQAIDQFQNDDKIQGIVGNIKTLGTGHNLTKGNVVVFLSIDWNSGEHSQGEDRAWRLGQERNVSCFYTIFQNTIEEVVYNRAFDKRKNNELMLNLKD